MPKDPKVHEPDLINNKTRCGRPLSSYHGDLPVSSDPKEVTCGFCRKHREGTWGLATGPNSGRRNFGEIRLPGSHTR